jgi:hypothetical protein
VLATQYLFLACACLCIHGGFVVISVQQEFLSTECQREKTEIENSRYEKFENFFCGGIECFQSAAV